MTILQRPSPYQRSPLQQTMTLHAEISKAVEAWLLKHGKNRCTMNNGLGDLVELYLKHNPFKTEEQAMKAISDALRKNRGIIQLYTQKGCIMRCLGAPTSRSSEVAKQSNNTNNPIKVIIKFFPNFSYISA